MKRRAGDSSDLPLEEVLENVEEAEAPEGLRERCLACIRELAAREEAAPVRSIWRPVLKAAAAGAVISLVAMLTLPMFVQLPKVPVGLPVPTSAKQPAAPAGPPLPATEAPSVPAQPPDGARLVPEAGKQVVIATPGPGTPPLAQTERSVERLGTRSGTEYKHAVAGGHLVPVDQLSGEAGDATVVEGDSVYRGVGRRAYDDSFGMAVEMPWYDGSGERQKIVHQELEVAVRDVEKAFDRAESIIEKADGHIEDVDMRLEKGEEAYAHFTARVPVDKLDEVMSQLRDLGEVVLLRGESEDASKEYWGRGEEIREMGATEDELVRKYMAEKNRRKKQQLYQQIMALRARNKPAKEQHQELSEETHYAYVDVTLTEQATPLRFLGEAFGSVGRSLVWIGVWLAATAVIWLPLLTVVGVIWRRRRRAG